MSTSLSNSHFIKRLHKQILLPILRFRPDQPAQEFCKCLFEQGFEIIEITLTTPKALELIQAAHEAGICIGAGTVLNGKDARRALDAGAEFLVSPGLSTELVELTQAAGVPYFPGVLSPTEVMTALNLGIDTLKFFPAGSFGPEYLKHLGGPFPQIKWLPTGGIAFAEIPAYLKAGALAIGQGTRLISAAALDSANWSQIETELTAIQSQLANWRQA